MSGVLTIKELRKILDDDESKWTEEDFLYFGEFEDQLILSFIPGEGYTFSKIEESFGEGGYFIIPVDAKGNEIEK